MQAPARGLSAAEGVPIMRDEKKSHPGVTVVTDSSNE